MNTPVPTSNHRIKNIWPNILWQPAIAIIFMLIVLYVLNLMATSPILWAVGSGSLASSCFLIFGQPSSSSSSPRRVVGGYLIGIVVGLLVSVVMSKFVVLGSNFLQTQNLYAVGLCAATAVGLSLIVMALLDLEHPPSAGMTLVLVVDVRDYYVVAVVFVAAIVLALLKIALRKWLRDLNVYSKCDL